jgi:hypothetical protein
VLQHLEQPHHGEVPDVRDEPTAGVLNTVPAEPEHVEGPGLLPKVADEVAGVQIARRFPTGDEDPRAGGGVHRARL